MSSLLHPIHGAREKFRPKHQVLVLRCYPKFQKNVQEIKPNSSELSYLLYYTSSRRSKLQKVGAFLEKKAASDVWRLKIGNVQVTLQILTAIIEKVPRDLSLYAGSVLTILNTVLQSKDINMIEESLPTFEAYCKFVDTSSLAADQERTKQYQGIIQQYAAFTFPDEQSKKKHPRSLPESIRWRTLSLRAIRAVVGSDALVIDSSAQLNIVMPVILHSLNLEKDGGMRMLQERAQTGEKQSMENARKRRMSSATITTVDEIDTNPAMASGTTADADKAAEEEVRVLAVRCLKQIFSVTTSGSRGQLRLATALVLKFIASKDRPRPTSKPTPNRGFAPDWSTSLFETIARWTPVQDRFVILITAMETLVRSPIVETVLEKQIVLARLIDWLLRSDINLIGLSVMDILLGLMKHTLLLLQLGGRDATVMQQSEHIDTLGIYKETLQSFDPKTKLAEPEKGRLPSSTEVTPSTTRIELLDILEKSISDLATHIYYTDQISDMMTAILARLKPSNQSETSSIAAAINDPVAATKAIAESGNLQEDPSTDRFFSFTTARVTALKAVKDILVTANSRRTSGGVSAEARSRVGIQVWDGTQWLLKDEDAAVRLAYIDAILTWLRLETNKSDLLLPKGDVGKVKKSKKDGAPNGDITLAKRAVSNASRREAKPAKSTFLQLLHLAIYDSAIDRADSEPDLLLLYILLWTLVERLGVNAIRTGLPMILNLQNSVLNSEPSMSPRAKMHVASLVHGYLWAIAEKLDIEATTAGAEINSEISRRKRFGSWHDKVKFPPSSVSQINHNVQMGEKRTEVSEEAINGIRPFLSVNPFVDEIANAYDNLLLSPPSSPPASPGRVFSVPTLGFGYGYSVTPATKVSREGQLPQKVKDEMCGQWSREACIAAIDKEQSPSVNGSRTGTSSGQRNYLSVQNQNETNSGRESPNMAGDAVQTGGLTSGIGSLSKYRNFSVGSSVRDLDTSSRDSTMRVSDLKRALATGNASFRNESPLRKPANKSRTSLRSSGSESMMSWNPDDNESIGEDPNSERPGTARPATSASQRTIGSLTNHDQAVKVSADPRHDEDIPPVPKIPSTLNLPGTWPRDASPVRPEPRQQEDPKDEIESSPPKPPSKHAGSINHTYPTRKQKSRPTSRAGGSSIWSEKYHTPTSARKTDLNQLLAGIDTDTITEKDASIIEKEKLLSPNLDPKKRIIKPPY